MEDGGGGGSSSKYLYIDGKIWVDKPLGKQDEYNDLYDQNGDSLYSREVKVSLIDSNGKTISTTTKNGSYSINTGIKITSSTSKESIANNLKGYYLKFDYETGYSEKVNGKDVRYIVSLVNPNLDKENGSKALIKDNKLGEAYIYNLSDYVDKFYSYQNLSNMHMGLKLIKEDDYRIEQDVAYVKVVMNGYTYTYNYRGTGKTENTAAPTVKFGNGKVGYERTIYPSDIAYNNKVSESLQIYVVYRINIMNDNRVNYGKKKSETTSTVSYVEVGLKDTELYNKYDTNRYEIENNYDSNKYDGDFKNWKSDGTGKVKYVGNKLDELVTYGQPRTIYIQFKVTGKALNDLLNNKETTEDKPTTATTTAYHEYWSAGYEWKYKNGKWEHELVFSDNKTPSVTQSASANYLGFNIGTERTITGKVFEDKNIYTNGEVLGNGMYDKEEQTVKNVRVDLFAENGTTIAKTYSSKDNYVEKDATTVSNNDGTYSFVGVTPGKYIVRFTYGDGTQVLCNLDGTEYKETNTKITLDKYKSTIVTDTAAMKALGYESSSKNEEWYKNVKSINYSVATDNLDQRAEYNANKTRTNIEANTALMSVSVENTKEDYVTITKSDNGTKETISGMNLGIIEIPEISLAFDKVVNNVQITNAQGNIIADGNPATQNMKVVNDLDKSKHLVDGSTYVKSEIAENELYGSTLRLTYAVTVQNNSDINYYEKNIDKNNKYYGYYYKFGVSDINGISTEETITVDTVLDCLDPSIQYEAVDEKHKVDVADISSNQDAINKMQGKTNLTYTTVYDIKNWKPLYSTKYTDNGGHNKEDTQDTATLQAARLLSAQDGDLSVSNVAQVTKMHVTDTPSLIETIDSSEHYFSMPNPTEEVYVTVTPPTGKDKLVNVIYGVTSAIALVILSVGIVVIKKGFIDKK